MKKVLNFIQYHNAVILIAFIIFGGAGTIFAANEIVKANSGTTEVVEEVDTRALRAVDLDSFDMDLHIVDAVEQEDSYVITYVYTTLAIVDHEWQIIDKEDTITIAKSSLNGSDIQTYALKQLSEVVDYELAYLKKAQVYEKQYAENNKKQRFSLLDNLSLSSLQSAVDSERAKLMAGREGELIGPIDTTVEEVDNEKPLATTTPPKEDGDKTTTETCINSKGKTVAVREGFEVDKDGKCHKIVSNPEEGTTGDGNESEATSTPETEIETDPTANSSDENKVPSESQDEEPEKDSGDKTEDATPNDGVEAGAGSEVKEE